VGVSAQDWSSQQQLIIDALERLGAATRPDGGGPDAYAEVLAPEYTRWTMGEGPINDRDQWIAGVRGWWENGWRVVDSNAEYLEVTVHGDFATTRRIVEETYHGPSGEESHSRTALAETWVRRDGTWLLLRVNAHPLER
jgi:hypothetical protein